MKPPPPLVFSTDADAYRPFHIFDSDVGQVRTYPVERIAAARRVDPAHLAALGTEVVNDLINDTARHVEAEVQRHAYDKRFDIAGPVDVVIEVRAEARAVPEAAGLEPRHLDHVHRTGARMVIVRD